MLSVSYEHQNTQKIVLIVVYSASVMLTKLQPPFILAIVA